MDRVKYTGACLDYNNVSIHDTWHLWTTILPFGSPAPAPRERDLAMG
jgi:hypothetical protein